MDGFSDGRWQLQSSGGVTRTELTITSTHIDFSRHHFRRITVAPSFVLDISTARNMCQQHACFKKLVWNCSSLQKPRFQRPSLPFWICEHIHDFTPCSLHSRVTNSLILSWTGVSTVGCTPPPLTRAWQWFPVLNVSICLSCDLISNGYGRPLLLKLRRYDSSLAVPQLSVWESEPVLAWLGLAGLSVWAAAGLAFDSISY